MSVVWYWAEGGRREGPMPWAALRDAARAGAFTPEAWIWTQGYGAEWRKASTLAENLFPKPEGDGAPGAPAAPGTGAAGSESPAPAASSDAAPDAPAGGVAERSPFLPRLGETGRPRKVVATRSLVIGLANMRVVLFRPFSFVRYLLFALPVLMAWVGLSSGTPALPVGPLPESQAARVKSLGLEGVTAPFSEFFEKRIGSAASPKGIQAAMADPEGFVTDMAAAAQRSSAALAGWFRRPGGLALAVAGFLVLLLLCAVSSWFLARAWALMLERVYRRDEPSGLAWIASARPAAALFRGLFAIRAAFLAAETALLAHAVVFFASLPGGAARGNHVAGYLLAFTAVDLAGALVAGIVRDFALPLMSLRGMAFRPAMAAALRSLGWWFPRYLALSVPVMAAAQAFSQLVVLTVFGIVGAGSAFFAPAFSLAATPWFLMRRLWTLDICFDLAPGLREAMPPRGDAAARGADFRDADSGGGPDGGNAV